MARKKRRKGKALSGVFTLLRYVLIAVVAVMLGYGAGQLVIQVIAARLGEPATVQTQSGSNTATPEQSAATGTEASSSRTSSDTGTKASSSTSVGTTNTTGSTSTAGTTSTTNKAGTTGTTGTTGSTSQPVGSSVPAPTSPTPNPTAQPQPTQLSDAEAVPAVATPKPLTETTQPNAETQPATGELWRVRLGKFATREEAEVALVKVREIVPQAYVIYADQYQIQAGAFSERSRAVAFLNELAGLNLTAEIVSSAP